MPTPERGTGESTTAVHDEPDGAVSSGMNAILDFEMGRLRAMTASEKVAIMNSLWRQAWALKEAGIRGQHPDASAEQVQEAVRAIFLREAR